MTEAQDETAGEARVCHPPRPAEELPGFRPMVLRDPFEAFVGPLYAAADDDPEGTARKAAFRVDDRHVDETGSLHPGMLMTFADAVLGSTAWAATGRRPCVTLSLQTNFAGAARHSDLVIVETRLIRRTRAIIFCAGDFFVDGAVIGQATSLWKVLGVR